MRILLVSDGHLRRELGAAKVVIELAEELERLGWTCRLSSLPELVGAAPSNGDARPGALRAFLREHAAEFDVVDYGHSHLPFPRSDFPAAPLFVARSVLLAHHLRDVKVPVYRSWKARLHALVYGRRDRAQYERYLDQTDKTLAEADLVNVSNDDDKVVLVRNGVSESKIVVFPFGLSRDVWAKYEQMSSVPPTSPVVAFVGTFDGRKGATDFPEIVRRVTVSATDVTFRLFGTFKSKSEVLSRFPPAFRARIEVIPQYSPNDLPALLAPCSIGVFPSYVEGFGFGVLEMLAAGLPVIAYDAPGPPMMLSPQYLVTTGDANALGDKVVDLLISREKLAAAREWAKERSRQFLWIDIARRTSEVYLERWQHQQRALTGSGRQQ